MAKKTRKCLYCKVDDTDKEQMEVELVESGTKTLRKHYHKECYVKLLEERAFKAKEAEELDKLVNVIMKMYGVKTLPNSVYVSIQGLRNGTKFFGKKNYKYKEGYTYDLIAETFEYCSETIEYWNGRIPFDGATGAIRYGLAIVCDKLFVVEQRRKRREEQRRLADIHLQKVDENDFDDDTNNNYQKPTKNKGDITDFLDD